MSLRVKSLVICPLSFPPSCEDHSNSAGDIRIYFLNIFSALTTCKYFQIFKSQLLNQEVHKEDEAQPHS